MRADDTRPPVLSQTRVLIVVAALVFVVAVIAGLQGLPLFTPAAVLSGDSSPIPLPAQTMQDSTGPMEEGEANPIVGIAAGIIGILFALAVLFLLIRFLIRFLRDLWASRPLAKAEGIVPVSGADDAAAETVPGEADTQAPIIRRGIAGALSRIDERVAPSDAIVAAWLGLEESAENAGQQRGVAETPGEFTVRIVGSRPGSAAEIRTLLRLYESVRFGGHEANEQDRDLARSSLHAIEEDWA